VCRPATRASYAFQIANPLCEHLRPYGLNTIGGRVPFQAFAALIADMRPVVFISIHHCLFPIPLDPLPPNGTLFHV